jgi:hypothetical protein
LPNTLIPKNNVSEYLEVFGIFLKKFKSLGTKEKKNETLSEMLKRDLKDHYYTIFGLLIFILNYLFVESTDDAQVLDNLGTIFSPVVFKPPNDDSKLFLQTLFKCKEVMKHFIEGYETLIDTELVLSYLVKYPLSKTKKKVSKNVNEPKKFNQEISRKVSLDSRSKNEGERVYSIRNFDRSFDIGSSKNKRTSSINDYFSEEPKFLSPRDRKSRRSQTLKKESPGRKRSGSKSSEGSFDNSIVSEQSIRYSTIWIQNFIILTLDSKTVILIFF